MNETVTPRKSKLTMWIGGGLLALLLTSIAGFFIYSSICPCAVTPGGYLFGERVTTPVTDWNNTTANQENLCQLQIWDGLRPHSINLNCMATTQGELFLSCSVCERKYWASKVGANEAANLRLGKLVYPVTINRESDPAAMDRAFHARVLKLQYTDLETMVTPRPPLDEQRADHWWTYRVVSRS